jgi:hypothetical protein
VKHRRTRFQRATQAAYSRHELDHAGRDKVIVSEIAQESSVLPDPSTRKIRRVVTGLNEAGRSTIVEDAVSPHATCFLDCPYAVGTDLWVTTATPVENSGEPVDLPNGRPDIVPPQLGSIFRTVEFPAAHLAPSGPDGEPLTPWMHETPSLDYCIVLSGELYALLEESETRLAAGDVLIQRGVKHAWSNRSDAAAVVAFVMISGTLPSPDE